MSRVCKSRPIAVFLQMGRVPCCPMRLVRVRVRLKYLTEQAPAPLRAHAFNDGSFSSTRSFALPSPSTPQGVSIKKAQCAIYPKPQIGRPGTVGAEAGWKGVMWIPKQPQMPGCSTHYHRALSANLPGEANKHLVTD